MICAGREDLSNDKRLADNAGRFLHEAEIDQAINDWVALHPSAEVLAILADASVPAGPIYSVEDMFDDPHYRARGLFEPVKYAGGELEVAAIHPRLSETPGRTDRGGPDLGEHTEEVLTGFLDMNEKELSALRDENIV